MKLLARSLSIQENIIFTGFVNLNEAINYYRTSDVFVLPAVSGPFGITVFEAMSSWTPAIISTTTDVRETLRNILKTEFWDSDLLVEYIVGVLRYRSLRSTLGSLGQIEAKRFTWENAAIETMEAHSSL